MKEFRIHIAVDEQAAYDWVVIRGTGGGEVLESIRDRVAQRLATPKDWGAIEVVSVEEVPGELGDVSFAHMLKLLRTYRAILKDSDAPDHHEAVMVSAAYLAGAASLYGAQTGQHTDAVHAALRRRASESTEAPS